MALTSSVQGRDSAKVLRPRALWAVWLTAAAFSLLLVRLYTLQIVRGEEMITRGRQNYVHRVEIRHDRGIIFDREGRILADNRPSLNVEVIPHFLGEKEAARATLTRLGDILHLDAEALASVATTVLSKRGLDRFVPVVVQRDISREQVEVIEAEKGVFRLDGVNIVEGRRRMYRLGTAAAHVLGYVNEIDAHRLDREKQQGNPLHYERGDLLGRAGLENTYEKELRGTDGYEKVVVDAKGRRMKSDYVEVLLGEGRRKEPEPGHNIFLTIDAGLQLAAEDAFDGRAGAAVALDPNTGAVLAMVSVPPFDPNLVSGALAKEQKDRLDTDPLKPWINRAIQGQYAPGSTYKAITGLAALTAGVATPTERVNCPGYFRLGRYTWRCHRERGHGLVDLKTALKVSCDTYFYTMSARMGITPIAEMSRQMGLGARTKIEIRGEKPGLIPDEAFHDRVDKASGGYQKGMAVNTSIGQGAVLVTPLQLAVAYAAIANGGTVYRPRLVERVETADFRVVRRYLPDAVGAPLSSGMVTQIEGAPPQLVERKQPDPMVETGIDPSFIQAIRDGLIAVAQEPGGTAYWRRSRKVLMAGKTGTSQVVRLGKTRKKSSEVPYEERDHAWFGSYAPIENPEIVVVVVNEHSGHGSSQAAPIAVRIIDAYVELKEARAARVEATAPADSAAAPGASQ